MILSDPTATPHDCRRDPEPRLKFEELGYYDGPTSGAIECLTCGKTYAFEMLDWDGQQNVRIFGLTPLARERYEAYLLAAARQHAPDAVPSLGTREGEAQLKAILGQTVPGVPPDSLIAWSRNADVVITVRAVSEDEKRQLTWLPWEEASMEPDWFRFIGLPRHD